MGGPAVLEIDNLTRRFGARAAVDGVSFSVAAGEIVGLLGPNGSGKTTIFRILATLMPPSAGTARVDGCDVAREPAAVRRRIGIVFQSPSLDRVLTARENMRHQGRLYGLSGRALAEAVETWLARLDLADRADDRTAILSGGQRRRVEIAKGLLHRPALLLMDEPSTGLDPAARRRLWAALDDVRRTAGVAILLTTHDMDEAERCDRVAILDAGRLVALDAPSALRRRIGGSVTLVRPRDPDGFGEALAGRLGLSARRLGEVFRLEHVDGAACVGRILNAFGGEIRAVEVSEPTLEDVFLARTGRTFWDGTRAGAGEVAGG